MAGLDPAIHVFVEPRKKDVDARHKAGHDEVWGACAHGWNRIFTLAERPEPG
jgi:hypothetical protein